MTAPGVDRDMALATLRAMLLDIDRVARIDPNDNDGTYEVRVSGHHVGFLKIDQAGRPWQWI